MNDSDFPDVPKSGPEDKAHTAVKAIISLIPGIGGAAAEIFSKVLVPPLSKRRAEWMESVADALRELESKVGDFKIENLADNQMFITALMPDFQGLPVIVQGLLVLTQFIVG